jgi:PhnB protein
MAERRSPLALSAQFDAAVEAVMTNTPPPPLDPQLAPLLQLAADLRDLPRADFKARLKADLQRRGPAALRAKPIPEGYHTATPCLVLRDAAAAIDFYKRAFGATELMRFAQPSGQIMHAEIQLGDSRIAIAPEAPQWGNLSPQALRGSAVPIQLYVEDVDAFAERAVAAGAKVLIPVANQFYGDRAGRLADPFGHVWIVGTHKEDVTADEMRRRAEAWRAKSGHPTTPEPSTEGSYVVEPYLPVQNASRLLDFLKQAFAAEETSRHTRPDGSIAHAEVRIGDSAIGIGDSIELQPAPTALHLYVPDADAIYARALRAGATSVQEPADQHYGDREAGVKDPFGNHWYIGTHKAEAQTRTRLAAYIPEGLHSISSYLHPHGAPQLIDFLKRAFGAEEAFRAQAPDGTVVHARIRIGESVVEMGEAHGPYQPMPTVYHLYVDDTDTVYRRAVAAGAVALAEPTDQPWGYRNAGVRDPAGNQWWINAPTKISTPAGRRQPEAAAKLGAAEEPSVSFHTVTPFLQVRDVGKTVEFLKEAFGAEVIAFDRGGDPPHDHADLRIGDSMIMMGEALAGHAPTTSAFYLSVADVDAAYGRALHAGARAQQPPKDMPWGHRMAHVKDEIGNSWFIAAPKKN